MLAVEFEMFSFVELIFLIWVLIVVGVPVGLLVLILKLRSIAKKQMLESKKCQFCSEMIKREAVVCRFCGHEQKAEDLA